MMGPPLPPPGGGRGRFEYKKVTPPKSFKDLSRYLNELVGGFFFRLFYIFRLVWETGPWILFVMLFMSVFNGVMPVIGALISKNILNMFQNVMTDKTIDFNTILIMFVFLFLYRIINNVMSRLNNIFTSISGERVVDYIKRKIMNKAKTVDLSSFDRPEFYEKLENANREAGSRPIAIMSSTFGIVSTLISMISFIVILASISPLATLVIIAISVPSAIINFVYRKKTFTYMRRRSKERRQMGYFSGLLVDKDLAKELKLFDLSDGFIDRYKKVFKEYFSGIKKLIINEGLWHAGLSVISSTVNFLFYVFIGYKVYLGNIMIGDYSLYTNALQQVANGVSSLISITSSIYEGTLFIDNMIEFMNEKQTIVPRLMPPVVLSHGMSHTVEFKNVSFRYPGTQRDVLKNISTVFRPGESVVLVGLNGSGKTTLIKLLTRLYDPTEGEILLDGRNIKDYDLKSLYKTFGIIFQDFGKYAVTASENITFGDVRHEFDLQAVKEAARQSNADDFIEKLNSGYETPLMRIFEADGAELSGGQWQKLAIARAFYSNSDILILDEPTASLDPLAEQEIFNQFDNLRKGKTTLFVSHRLSSATTASKILVLQNGVLIEEGRHSELMAKNGVYNLLFTTQAKRYIDADNNNPQAESADLPQEKAFEKTAGENEEVNNFSNIHKPEQE
ncbi:MAG: ABC transporter ATP-binding protein [Oscillospiraceae bacterium]|nr:ABC transporter ATP-binding protein [Oscillospiraceae bacterium]